MESESAPKPTEPTATNQPINQLPKPLPADLAAVDPNTVYLVPTRLINVPRERVTSVWDPALQEEFEESVKSKGILEPVRLLLIDGEVWLRDGLHRIELAEKLKMDLIPALLHIGSTDDLLIENIISNRQRGKSNPAQEAEVLAYLVKKRNFPLDTAANQLGLSPDWARKLLRIATLPDDVKDLIKHGKIPVTGAFYICDLDHPDQQSSVARDAAAYSYNAYQIKARVWALINPDRPAEEGSFTFTQNGKPQKIPMRCAFCGDELPETGKAYVWIDAKCEALLRDLYSYYQKEYGKPSPPSPVAPPSSEKAPSP
jgi:ParB/RepB/Spo0J family partition protein